MDQLLRQSRLDFSTGPSPDKIKRTPQGGIIADSRPTRVGILTYKYPDGRTVKEFRSPEEVFHPDSLASLAGCPVTVNHPVGGKVTPKNWKALTKGHVGDAVKADGNFVDAPVRIQDEETTRMVERGDLKEMSCGYTADVDFIPGMYNGEHYDAIQRNIQYNHVALLPVGRGRAGREVGLRMDGVEYTLDMSEPNDSLPTQVLDAKDFVARSEYETLKGQLAAVQSELANANKAKQDALDAISPKAIDALVNERAALIGRAHALAGKTELKTDGKSALEIMTDAVKAARPELKLDGESEAFVRGVFTSLHASTAAVAAAHEKVQAVANAPKTDSNSNEDPIAQARKRMLDHNAGLFGKKESV